MPSSNIYRSLKCTSWKIAMPATWPNPEHFHHPRYSNPSTPAPASTREVELFWLLSPQTSISHDWSSHQRSLRIYTLLRLASFPWNCISEMCLHHSLEECVLLRVHSTFFTHLKDRQLGHFQFGTVRKSASLNVTARAFWWIPRYKLRIGISAFYSIGLFSLNTGQHFSRVAIPVYTPPACMRVTAIPHPHQHLKLSEGLF